MDKNFLQNKMYFAAKEGNEQVISELISQGCDINAEVYDRNMLYFACVYGNFQAVQYLVKKGVILNTSFDDNNIRENSTALDCAIHYNFLDIAKFLLENGAVPNIFDLCKLNNIEFFEIAYKKNTLPKNEIGVFEVSNRLKSFDSIRFLKNINYFD
jgi:ankyrin repeat protein